MSDKFRMDDYIDVAERLVDFHGRYPEGTLQTISWSVDDVAGKTFIVYRAAAYRTPDDKRPGHGIAWEPFPGATSFTKNSELMNAETAAWGRAILACGLPAKRGLASLQEVRNRVEEQKDSKPSSRRQSPTRPNTRTTPTEGASGAENAPKQDAAPNGDAPASDDTLKELGKMYKAAKATEASYRAILTEVGVPEDKGTADLTEDQATWVVLKLRAKVEGK